VLGTTPLNRLYALYDDNDVDNSDCEQAVATADDYNEPDIESTVETGFQHREDIIHDYDDDNDEEDMSEQQQQQHSAVMVRC